MAKRSFNKRLVGKSLHLLYRKTTTINICKQHDIPDPSLWYKTSHTIKRKSVFSIKKYIKTLKKPCPFIRWQTCFYSRVDRESLRNAEKFPVPPSLAYQQRMLIKPSSENALTRYAAVSPYLTKIVSTRRVKRHYNDTSPYRRTEFFFWDQIFVAKFLYQRLMYYGEMVSSQLSVLSMLQYLKQWICQHLVEFIELFLIKGFPVFFELVRVKQSNREHDFPVPIRRKTLRGFMLKKFITKFRKKQHASGFFSSFVDEVLAWQIEPGLSFLFQYFEGSRFYSPIINYFFSSIFF